MSDEISASDLMASSIHDMKNALNLHVSALEKIAMQCQQRGESASFHALGEVLYQSNRMNLQLLEVLSLYKLGNAMYPIDMDERAVGEMIGELVLETRFMMAFKNIRLSVDCAQDCCWYFDQELVKGTLMNALNNAYQHCRDAIHIAARVQQQTLEIRVEDNGPGYPASLLARGVSIDKAVSFTSGSTGLGFYFCNQVARLHKNGPRRGAVHIENGGTLGGACFVLSLP